MTTETTATEMRVYMKKQDILPASVLNRMVGTNWWLMNCHGAKTLNSVEGIQRARVREDYSTFWLYGVFGTLYHQGKNAWLRKTVHDADHGRAVRAGWHILDLSGFVPDGAHKPDTRRGDKGRPRCRERVATEAVSSAPRSRATTKVPVAVLTPDASKVPALSSTVACKLFEGHEGEHKPRIYAERREFARR